MHSCGVIWTNLLWTLDLIIMWSASHKINTTFFNSIQPKATISQALQGKEHIDCTGEALQVCFENLCQYKVQVSEETWSDALLKHQYAVSATAQAILL